MTGVQTCALPIYDAPVLLDRFLDDAIEVDVDAVCDGNHVTIGGIMQHIEQAGVHSGDSACSLPPYSLSDSIQTEIKCQMRALAAALGVVGLMNAQFAVKGDKVYLIEVNPRASRTAPFVSKVIGYSLAKVGALCMVGKTLAQQNADEDIDVPYHAVKEAVFPFSKFLGVDPLLGPEMKSTGEVMGVGRSFAEAFAKAQMAAGNFLKCGGRAFISVRDADKKHAVEIGRDLATLGFELVATGGTASTLEQGGLTVEKVLKVTEGRPHVVDMIKNEEISFIVNTTEGKQAIADSYSIRREALQHKIPYTTTIAGARASCMAMAEGNNYDVYALQVLHKELGSLNLI